MTISAKEYAIKLKRKLVLWRLIHNVNLWTVFGTYASSQRQIASEFYVVQIWCGY